MKKEYILIIDSGIGGLSTLSTIYQRLSANYIYFADNKNAPYGNHLKEEIFLYLKEIIINLSKKYNVSMVVLACNTATTSAINKLRKQFKNIKFIGTEPAIKLAHDSNKKNILCIATPTTIKQSSFKKLAKSLSSNIKFIGLPNLASSIENYYISKNFWDYFVLQKNLYEVMILSKQFDCLVFGCTHYIFIKEKFYNLSNLETFDGNLGVCNQVLLWHEKLLMQNPPKSSVKFLFSKDNNSIKQIYKKIFYEILAKI